MRNSTSGSRGVARGEVRLVEAEAERHAFHQRVPERVSASMYSSTASRKLGHLAGKRLRPCSGVPRGDRRMIVGELGAEVEAFLLIRLAARSARRRRGSSRARRARRAPCGCAIFCSSGSAKKAGSCASRRRRSVSDRRRGRRRRRTRSRGRRDGSPGPPRGGWSFEPGAARHRRQRCRKRVSPRASSPGRCRGRKARARTLPRPSAFMPPVRRGEMTRAKLPAAPLSLLGMNSTSS